VSFVKLIDCPAQNSLGFLKKNTASQLIKIGKRRQLSLFSSRLFVCVADFFPPVLQMSTKRTRFTISWSVAGGFRRTKTQISPHKRKLRPSLSRNRASRWRLLTASDLAGASKLLVCHAGRARVASLAESECCVTCSPIQANHLLIIHLYLPTSATTPRALVLCELMHVQSNFNSLTIVGLGNSLTCNEPRLLTVWHSTWTEAQNRASS
jgi:hypothetical protein